MMKYRVVGISTETDFLPALGAGGLRPALQCGWLPRELSSWLADGPSWLCLHMLEGKSKLSWVCPCCSVMSDSP